MKNVLMVLMLGLCAFASRPAHAHATSNSYLIIDLPSDDGPVELHWALNVQNLAWAIFIDENTDGTVTWGEVQAAQAAIERGVLGQIAVQRGGAPCALGFGDLALDEQPDDTYLSVALRAECPRAGAVGVSGALFMTGDVEQRVMLTARRGAERMTAALSAEQSSWTEPVTHRVSAWESFVRFVREGVWHVAIGYDHIAFVLLLLLPSVLRQVEGRWQGASGLGQVARDVITIVTAFTIAHSITLALAVTNTVRLPTQPIEVAIAASIAVAGAINLLPRLSRARLPVAFGFGLVHGFGFANVLAALDAHGAGLVPLLAGFNIGVELAQLAIVALVLPLIYSMRLRRWYSGGVMPLGSCVLGTAGVVWLIQRL